MHLPFRENGKRFCINFVSNSHPKPYLGLGKKEKSNWGKFEFPLQRYLICPGPFTNSYLVRHLFITFVCCLSKVLNDADASLWDILSVSCWPTLVVVSPTMKALTIFEGEGNRVALLSFVSTAMKFYEERHILVNKNPLPVVVENLGEDEVDRPSNGSTASSLKLSHPGKIAVSGKRIAVADSANHRIIVGALEEKLETSEIDELYCQVEYVIGGPSPGFEDCSFRSSCSSSSSSLAPLFRFPQGLVWYDDEGEEKLIVADTENHLVRIISFPKASKKGKVETLVGKPGNILDSSKISFWTDVAN